LPNSVPDRWPGVRQEGGLGVTGGLPQALAWRNIEQECFADPGSRRKVTFC
jgi:hypothetical protein